MTSSAMPVGVVLAFDFGLQRIGVAVGNSVMRQATPLQIISAATNDANICHVKSPTVNEL